MANEHNNNVNITQTARNDEATVNSAQNVSNEGGGYNSNNHFARNDQTFPEPTAEQYNKSQERPHRKSRTVSFSEDTCDLKDDDIIKNGIKTTSTDANKPTTNVEYDDSNVPYDRGWAWVIDFSCFLLFFVYLSHDHWHSVLLLDYMQEFHIPITVLTIMLSVGSAFYCLATQISSNVLVVRFSIRVVTTCAAILNVAATLLFAVVPSITVFFIVNFIKYIVKGFTLIATLTLVGYYFRRRRGLATTLGLLGVGSSAMCAPPLIRYLRDEYGFRGCFLILAGLEMHAILAALLLRPISTYRRRIVSPEHSNPGRDGRNSLSAINVADCSTSSRRISVEELLEQIPNPPASLVEMSIAEADELGSNPAEEASIPLIREVLNNVNNNREYSDRTSESREADSKFGLSADNATVKANVESEACINKHNGNDGVDVHLHEVSNTKAQCDHLKQEVFTGNFEMASIPCETNELADEPGRIIKAPDEDTEIESGSQLNAKTFEKVFSFSKGKSNMSSGDDVSQISGFIRARSSSRSRHSADMTKPRRASTWSLVTASTMGSMLNIAHVIEPLPAADSTKPNTRFWIKDLIDVSLLKNYLAMMISLSYILVNMSGFSVVYLPSYAKRVGVSSQNAAILLTIVGSMDIVGRLSFGFLADLKIIRPHLIIAAVSAVIGTVTHFMPLFTDFETLILFSVAHGLFAGVGMNLTTVFVVDILGIEHLGKMLPMSSLFNSISFFIQHPIQGAIIEATGNFVATYHYIGTCLLLDTCLLLAEPLLRKLQVAKEKTQGIT